MTKYILVGGYITKAEDKGKAFCEELVNGIDKKPIKILDCLFARPEDDWNQGFEEDKNFLSEYISNFELELATFENFTKQVENCDVLFIKGGFTKMLMDQLSKDTEWLNYLDGKTVAGTSAGAEVLSKYYHILKSDRKDDGFGLVPVKVIPHWKSNFFDGEEWNLDFDKIIKELKDYKEDLPILTLKEGEFKIFNI